MKKNFLSMAIMVTMATLTHKAEAAKQYIMDNDDKELSYKDSHDHDIHRTVNLDDVVKFHILVKDDNALKCWT